MNAIPFRRLRWAVPLQRASYVAIAVVGLANAAGGAETGLQKSPAPIIADPHCASYGPGYFGVAGSSACVKISGYVSAGADFGPAARNFNEKNVFPTTPSSGIFAHVGIAGDILFDTEMGPGKISIGLGHKRNQP